MKRIILAMIAAAALWGLATAGNLEPGGEPDEPASAMFTLEDIYNRLFDGTPGEKRTDGFVEPTNGPGSTGHTLDEIMALIPERDGTNGALPSEVADGKTFWSVDENNWGPQTGTGSICNYPAPVPESGEDSDNEGVSWPDPRFTDNNDGTVVDELTGLVWMEWANCMGLMTWDTARAWTASLEHGDCLLSDGSNQGDWRVPNIKEILSLLDYGETNPPIKSGHPFDEIVTHLFYWTSTTEPIAPFNGWRLEFYYGNTDLTEKNRDLLVWPVRNQ